MVSLLPLLRLNILDGVTSTAAELNLLDGVTSTTAELNILDGVTATTVEINYVDGVTSNVQTQLDAKTNDGDNVNVLVGTTSAQTVPVDGNGDDNYLFLVVNKSNGALTAIDKTFLKLRVDKCLNVASYYGSSLEFLCSSQRLRRWSFLLRQKRRT